jgi:hypothetical protein
MTQILPKLARRFERQLVAGLRRRLVAGRLITGEAIKRRLAARPMHYLARRARRAGAARHSPAGVRHGHVARVSSA